jgi:hypothetical protein
MKLNKLQLNKLKTKYSEKTLLAMDVTIKHIKKNKEIYNMLVALLVLGFGDQVFIFLNDFVQNATIFGFGKNVSQVSTPDAIRVIESIGSLLLKEIQSLSVVVIGFLLSFKAIEKFVCKKA